MIQNDSVTLSEGIVSLLHEVWHGPLHVAPFITESRKLNDTTHHAPGPLHVSIVLVFFRGIKYCKLPLAVFPNC